jgi:hypothetical protein
LICVYFVCLLLGCAGLPAGLPLPIPQKTTGSRITTDSVQRLSVTSCRKMLAEHFQQQTCSESSTP